MRRWVRAVARLYPRSWRHRYGPEFAALVDDAAPVWSDLFDVLRGAVRMQVRTYSSYLKLAGGVAAAGVVVAIVAGLLAHGPFVSSSVIRLATLSDERPVDPQLPDRVNLVWQEVVGRASLAEVIRRPEFDLYKSERNRKPFEDVIEGMKRDIRIDRVDGSAEAATLRISFAYPDQAKAKGVVDALTRKLLDNPEVSDVSIVSGATLPEVPHAPDRIGFLEWGLGLGALFGVLSAFLRWRAKWTLKVIGFGLAGYIGMGYLCFEHRGLLPESYTSNATVRVTPHDSEGSWRLLTDAEMADWLRKQDDRILSNASLREIMERPAMKRYRQEQEIAGMRKNISIHLLPSRSAFTVSFADRDRFKAQQVVSALIAEFSGWGTQATNRYRAMVAASKSTHWSKDGTLLGCTIGDQYDFECIHNILAWQRSQHGAPAAAASLNVLEQASLPEHRAPSAESLMLGGMMLGLVVGARVLRNGVPEVTVC